MRITDEDYTMSRIQEYKDDLRDIKEEEFVDNKERQEELKLAMTAIIEEKGKRKNEYLPNISYSKFEKELQKQVGEYECWAEEEFCDLFYYDFYSKEV